IYAVAQGPVSIGGYNYRAAGSQVQQNHPTVAVIPNGAIVEREIEFRLGNEELLFYLDSPNFETARNIALAINSYFDVLFAEEKLAQAIDAGQVRVKVPKQYKNDVVDYIAKINSLEVRPGLEAKVVINERTGTIVMGHNVKISTVSVAHGNLTVTIRVGQEVSQPASFSSGETVVLEEGVLEVVEEEGSLTVLPTNSTVEDLVFALNALGASPRDIIAILELIDAQGALHARLELR
ncbi:MAG: flagellar basal body P-ring protein FlgI, partial [Halanaerobiales bacterium]